MSTTTEEKASATSSCASGCSHESSDNSEKIERKVPLWAKIAVGICVLVFLGFFFAFASAVSGGAGLE
jgi:hypothetical protein